MNRLLIVDDEKFVRAGIKKVVEEVSEWSVVAECENGNEALYYLENHVVDLVLSDIVMPDCDGIRFIQQLRQQERHMPVVFLTGHPDFTYAQEALRYGAVDYLLKPCLAKDIRAMLEKMENKLNVQQIELLKQPAKQQSALRSLLHGTKKKTEVEAYLPQWMNERGSYRVIAVQHVEPTSGFNSLAMTSLEQLQSIYSFIIWEDGPSQSIIVLEEREELLQQLLTIASQSNDTIRLGISSVVADNDLMFAYRQSKLVLSFATEHCAIIRYNELLHSPPPILQHSTSELELQLMKSVEQGNEALLQETIQTMKQAIVHYPMMELSSYLYRLLCQLVWRNNLELEPYVNNKLELLLIETSKQQLYRLFESIMSEIVISRKQQYAKEVHHIVQRTIRIIETNFQSNITLKDIAEQLNVSAAYLSVLFKQETDQTFSEFLIAVRMKAAQKMIVTSNKKIYEIAQEVGYTDGRHFSQVFKQVTGESPNQFRNNHYQSF